MRLSASETHRLNVIGAVTGFAPLNPSYGTTTPSRRGRRLRRDLAPFGEIDGGVENHLVALAHACAYLDGGAEVAHLGDLADVGDAILHHGNTQPVLVEDDRRRRHDQRRRLARNLQLNQTIGSRA